jgi:hypothetical protein
MAYEREVGTIHTPTEGYDHVLEAVDKFPETSFKRLGRQ